MALLSEQKQKDYIDLCAACNQGLTREELVYKKGKPFHAECFEKNGNNFQNPVPELLQESSDTKVQLVYLKNLKNRQIGTTNPSKSSKTKTKRKLKKAKKKPKRASRKSKKRKTRPKRKKTKSRASKRRTTKRRSKRVTKRRPTRKTKSKRKSKRR